MSLQKKAPIVSVIMPVFNGEKYVREAITSVLQQTFKDFEFIILNDGSTDATQDIINSFNDKRIICHYHKNQGVAKSLNVGLDLAKGNYIWRHDADDKSLPEQLQTQIDFFATHQDFALVATQIAFMTDRGKIAYDFKQPKDAYFEGKPFVKVERNHFNPYSPITHATVLLKREVLNTVGHYRIEFKTSEDTDLWLRILEHYNMAVLHYCPYFVRLNATSATKVHKKTNTFFRDLAYQFADERQIKGSDPLQRSEPMPKPLETQLETLPNLGYGKTYRSDLLDYNYKVMLNARDYKNIIKIWQLSIGDGWRLSKTWKALLFPLLGKKFIEKGVKLKKIVKS